MREEPDASQISSSRVRAPSDRCAARRTDTWKVHNVSKYVIAGASVYGLDNLSDDAMFKVFCDGLHAYDEDAHLTLLARHPSASLDSSFGVHSIPNLDHQTKEASLGRWYMGLNSGDDTDHLAAIWREIAEADLLVIGGEPFIDISLGVYRGPAPYASLLMTLAKFHGTPVMVNGIHMGRSLTTDAGKELTRYCVSNADLVTIREEQTRPILREMGITSTDHVITLADAAYGLDPAPDESRGREILSAEGIELQSDRLFGITFRHMYWRWDEETWARYSTAVADICDHLIDTYDADVLFVPHNTYTSGLKYENDLPAHSDIIARIRNQGRAHQIQTRLDVDDTLALFPLFEMTFSNRRHTLIFAALHGRVGLGVGEELHVKVTMEELGVGGDLFVDIEDFDAETVKENLDSVWANRERIRAEQDRRLPALRARALRHAELATELARSGS